ncbi:hypothetical protein [Chryseobacterium sp.]|jgi:hypothetical protein|uniref:hypothetical protein n=1 Tax=Chryseobacterium sp. TaxID=1871047 RepID=UPI00284F9A7B|nr:hypothetical protein [Chryseobacterium sp.]MDR3025479.1 hypothetical protein [Chryseobacterium sp.]
MKTKIFSKSEFLEDNDRIDQTDSLKELLADVLVLFEEYAEKHDVSNEEKETFKNIIFKYYLKKKGEIYLKEHLNELNIYVNKMLCHAVGNIKPNDISEYYDFYYYNKKHRHSITHDIN